MRKATLLILLLSFVTISSSATCIVLVIANDVIYIAADSKSVRGHLLSKGVDESSVLICKIHHVGNRYFAVSGHGDIELTDSAYTALKTTKDLNTAIGLYKSKMTIFYKWLMKQEKKNYPERYKLNLKQGLSQVCFFGFNNNKPYIKSLSFFPIKMKDQSIAIKIYEQNVDLIAIGLSDHISKLSYEELKKAGNFTPIQLAEYLVKVEEKSHPQYISEPIDLLELSNQKANWIRRQFSCD